MNSSRPQSPNIAGARSTAKSHKKIAEIQQIPLPIEGTSALFGSMNDGNLIRSLLTEVMRTCGKSRAQIADEMSYLSGQEVTERRLNGFTAESREDLRFPGELDRAFCSATGDDRLLKCRVELAGYKVIQGTDVHLLELGRQYLLRKRSEAELADLERRLEGSDL